VDVANPHAFARQEPYGGELALCATDLPLFEQLLSEVERDNAAEFRSGFIAESPRKLRGLYQYFAAVLGQGAYPPVRCNAPEFSAVLDARGLLRPCFFIPGPPVARVSAPGGLSAALNAPAMSQLRAQIRAGERVECRACVCQMWREPGTHMQLLPAMRGP